MNEAKKNSEVMPIVEMYIAEIKRILGADYIRASVYGSFARGDNDRDSDIDIVIFTSRPEEDFYDLISAISESTFEYNVRYNVMLSPVFENVECFNRRMTYVPFYQNIEREGIRIGCFGKVQNLSGK